MRSFLAAFYSYAANSDARAGIAATVALVVAGNQPFYPLYIHWIAGTSAWPAWLTLLTMPFFVALPAIARRNSLAGRAMLPVIGTANTVLCAKAIGIESGVEVFLFPCILLAGLLFRRHERLIMFAVLAVPFAAYLLLDPHLGAPIRAFGAQEYAAMISLHALSVASLFVVVALMAGSALEDAEKL